MVKKIKKLILALGLAKSIILIFKTTFYNKPIRLKFKDLVFYLRPRTNDINIFSQTFIDKLCDIDSDFESKLIIDGGAHIGLTALFYHQKFPNSKIIAVEPDIDNFNILQKNTENINSIHAVNAALWFEETSLTVFDKFNQGKWGMVTELNNVKDGVKIKATTIDKLVEEYNYNEIDVLKLDIEGAEKEIFEKSECKWLKRTKIIVIELHDDIKQNCTSTFFAKLDSKGITYSVITKGVNHIIKIDNYLP